MMLLRLFALLLLLATAAEARWSRGTGPDRMPDPPYIAGQMMICTDADTCSILGGFNNTVPIGGNSTWTFPTLPVCNASTGKLIFNGFAAASPWTCEADAGASSGAPSNAAYVVMALNSALSAERVATAGVGIGFTDGGANGNLIIAFSYANTLGSSTLGAGQATFASNGILFEGATGNAFETLLQPADVTADRTQTLKDASGTVCLDDNCSASAVKVGTAPPATCTVGQIFFDTNNACGSEFFKCVATDRWELISDMGHRWYNVQCFGAVGDATTDDGPAIQSAMDAAGNAPGGGGGGWVWFPPGLYKVNARCNSGARDGLTCSTDDTHVTTGCGAGATCPDCCVGLTMDASDGVRLVGAKMGETNQSAHIQFRTNMADKTGIYWTATCDDCSVEGLAFEAATGGGSAGHVGIKQAATGVSRSMIRDLFFFAGFYTAIDAGGPIRDVDVSPVVAGGTAFLIRDRISALLDHVVATLDVSSTCIDILDTTSTVDSVFIENGTACVRDGSGDQYGLRIRNTSGNFAVPRWVATSNVQFECMPDGSVPCISIESGQDIRIVNTYAVGGLNALSVTGGEGDVIVEASNLFAGGEDTVVHNSDTPMLLANSTVSDGSDGTGEDGLHAGIYLGSSSVGFRASNVHIRDGYTGSAENKYGIEVDAAATLCSFAGMKIESDAWDTSPALGLATCAAAPSYLHDAIGLMDSDGTNWGVIRPATTFASNRTFMLPDESGTLCTTGSVCSGYGDVTAAGPACASGACLTDGKTTSDRTWFIYEGTTNDGFEFHFRGPNDDPLADAVYTLPAATGTLCGTDAVCTGYQAGPLTGDVTTSGAAATIGTAKILASMIKSVDVAADEECLTRETTTGDFEWQACGSSMTLKEDTSTIDAATTTIDFTEPDATLTSGGAGTVTVDMRKYTLLGGRSGGQTIKGGTASGDDLTLESTAHGTKGTIFLEDPLELWVDGVAGTTPVVLFDPSITISGTSGLTVLKFGPTVTDNDTTAKNYSLIHSTGTYSKATTGANVYSLVRDSAIFEATSTNPLGSVYSVFAEQQVNNNTASLQALTDIYGVHFTPLISTLSSGNMTVAQVAGTNFWPAFSPAPGTTITVSNVFGTRMQLPINIGAGTLTFTNAFGLDVPALVGATTAVGVRSAVAAASGAYHIRGTGTAQSAFGGNVALGSNTTPNVDADVIGGLATRRNANTTTCTSCTSSDIDATDRSYIVLTGAAAGARTLHGIAGGVNGQRLTLYNADSQNLTVANDSGSEGTPANKIYTLGVSCVTTGNGIVTFTYDSDATNPRWILTTCESATSSIRKTFTFTGNFNCGTDPGSNDNYFAANGCLASGSEAAIAYTVTEALTVVGIDCAQSQDSTCTYRFTTVKNGTADATFQCTDTNNSGCADTTGSLAFAAADTISIRGEDNPGGAANCTLNGVTAGCIVNYTVP